MSDPWDNSRCACVARWANVCMSTRSGHDRSFLDPDEYDDEECECVCHDWEGAEDDADPA